MHLGASSRPAWTRGLFFALAVAAMFLFAAPAGATSLSKERSVGSLKLPSGHQTTSKTSFGELDCNGFSPHQESANSQAIISRARFSPCGFLVDVLKSSWGRGTEPVGLADKNLSPCISRDASSLMRSFKRNR